MSNVELTIAGRTRPASSARMVATLAISGMCSGFLLAATYQLTKPIIDENKRREIRAAVFKVVPGSTSVQRLAYRDGVLTPIPDTEKTSDPVIHAAYDDAGTFMGYGIVGEGPGFQDLLSLIHGYSPSRRQTTGMRVITSRETPGLGDGIIKDHDFLAMFEGLAVDPKIVVVKDGRDAPNEIDSLTGATITSKAVARIINIGNAFWADKLPPPGSEPPAPTSSGAGRGEEP